MKHFKASVISALVGCIGFGSVIPAYAETDTYQMHEGVASFFLAQSVGCVDTYQLLFVSEQMTRSEGDGQRFRDLSYHAHSVDRCTNTPIASLSITQSLEKYELKMGSGYARLMTSVPTDTGTVPIDLEWNRIGTDWKNTSVSQFELPDFKVIQRLSSQTTSARVTGSIGSSMIDTVGGIDTLRGGTITIEKK